MPDKNDLCALALAAAPFVAEAMENKRSMLIVDIDPVELFGLQRGGEPTAGKMLLAVAIGPSVPVLQDALKAITKPH